MQYYTRLQESPNLAVLALLKLNPTSKVAVVPLANCYGRAVAVRTVGRATGDAADAVYVCAGDNPIFVANVVVLAHAHNVMLADKDRHNGPDRI
jgi:CMP-2-keto-3-deoxyoctulosonic acid synthetase